MLDVNYDPKEEKKPEDEQDDIVAEKPMIFERVHIPSKAGIDFLDSFDGLIYRKALELKGKE